MFVLIQLSVKTSRGGAVRFSNTQLDLCVCMLEVHPAKSPIFLLLVTCSIVLIIEWASLNSVVSVSCLYVQLCCCGMLGLVYSIVWYKIYNFKLTGHSLVACWYMYFLLKKVKFVSGSSKIQTLSFDSSSIKTEIYNDGKTLRLLKYLFFIYERAGILLTSRYITQ